MTVAAIVAVSENNVIGRDGDLPWRLPKDMRFFKETTMGHHVIIGRKNWESIPEKFRPLPGRENIILTRQKDLNIPDVQICHELDKALEIARKAGDEEPFIIGGGQIYELAFQADVVDRIYLTRVHADITGEIRMPDLDLEKWRLIQQTFHPRDEKHAHAFTIQIWER